MASAPVITPAGIPITVWQFNRIIMHPPAAAVGAITSRGWPPPPPVCGYKRRPCNVLHQYVPGSGYSIRPVMMSYSNMSLTMAVIILFAINNNGCHHNGTAPSGGGSIYCRSDGLARRCAAAAA